MSDADELRWCINVVPRQADQRTEDVAQLTCANFARVCGLHGYRGLPYLNAEQLNKPIYPNSGVRGVAEQLERSAEQF